MWKTNAGPQTVLLSQTTSCFDFSSSNFFLLMGHILSTGGADLRWLIPHLPATPPPPPPPHYWSDDHSFLSPSDSLSSPSLSLSLSKLKVSRMCVCVCLCVCVQTPEHECFVSGRWLASDSYHQEETEGRWESCKPLQMLFFSLQSSFFLSVPSTKPSTPPQLSPALETLACFFEFPFSNGPLFFPLKLNI